jgi:type I restriction-modification system DNA methylase subunit
VSTPRPQVFVTISDIAEIASVGRSAVANWRKRHADFPLPNASERFDLEAVERWLIERGKIAGRAPRSFILWRLADALRELARPSDVMNFVLAGLVYLEACDRARSVSDKRGSLAIDRKLTWAPVREADDSALASRLIEAAVEIERKNPSLADLLTPGLQLATRTEAWLLRTFLDTVEEAAKDDKRFALFEEAIARVQDSDRFRGEFSTPSDLTHLMVRLGGSKCGTVFDPASGEGGLLLMAALGDDRDDSQPMTLVGLERNAEVMNVSRARFFLYDIEADLINADAFRTRPDDLPSADLVLLDPPLGTSDWGDADVYLDQRWIYGVPPPKNADLAWVQLAVQSLTSRHGRAIVATTPGALFRAGREAEIRSALLTAGCVRAVVMLPPRLRANISIPLALWVLCAPSTPPEAVLLVDAGQLGEAGRSVHSLHEDDIDRIVRVVRDFEEDPSRLPSDPKIAWRVALADLDGSNLDPSRYRPSVTVDLDDLRRRREELRATLQADTAEAATAVAAVLSRLKEPR